jgi:hypothetical protein
MAEDENDQGDKKQDDQTIAQSSQSEGGKRSEVQDLLGPTL